MLLLGRSNRQKYAMTSSVTCIQKTRLHEFFDFPNLPSLLKCGSFPITFEFERKFKWIIILKIFQAERSRRK